METYQVTDDASGDWLRNIVTLRASIDIFQELVDDPAAVQVLMEHELATKPTRDPQPIISRPFEDARTYDPIVTAIQWPFDHPAASRYSAGAYGVWYGARSLVTTVHETVHHFRLNTLASEIARESSEPIVQERRVHLVHCGAALVDLRSLCATDAALLDPANYTHCQALGAEIRAAFLPGVLTMSARLEGEEVAAVFVKEALSNPRHVCYLTYTLDVATRRVSVERTPGTVEYIIEP
ncbi:RES family NAD+ phosphorylase [Steroidobacter sp.]|uniref:RES family NAD+ phosphorylase n=1 Tax=Steroidobacter sp. TaxID=1978227 RepID=UPI001A5D3D2D|nr:RES family NAD+ phosphorylase [Steroidobacter sp.]MBL8265317.1 RES family NAD+ phosphorylase [Steroidobacter sp.]